MRDGFKIYRVETLLSLVISLLINICRRNGGGSAQQFENSKAMVEGYKNLQQFVSWWWAFLKGSPRGFYMPSWKMGLFYLATLMLCPNMSNIT
jgi:hypothetical protein